MSEELGLDEIGRERRTVDLHERSILAWTVLVDRASEELFPDPGLAFDKNRRVEGRHFFDFLQHVFQCIALSDNRIEAARRRDLALEVHDFVLEALREGLDLGQRGFPRPLGIALIGDVGADTQRACRATIAVAQQNAGPYDKPLLSVLGTEKTLDPRAKLAAHGSFKLLFDPVSRIRRQKRTDRFPDELVGRKTRHLDVERIHVVDAPSPINASNQKLHILQKRSPSTLVRPHFGRQRRGAHDFTRKLVAHRECDSEVAPSEQIRDGQKRKIDDDAGHEQEHHVQQEATADHQGASSLPSQPNASEANSDEDHDANEGDVPPDVEFWVAAAPWPA